MPDPVSATHGGVTVTSNTASAADLLAELQAPSTPAPDAPPEAAPAASADAGQADAAVASPPPVARERDEAGRFVKRTDGAPDAGAPADQPPAEVAAPGEPAPTDQPRREPSPRHDPVARMKQALAQKAEAERRANALAAELERIRTGVTSPVTPTPPGVTAPVMPQTNGHAGALGAEPQFEQFADQPDPYTAYVQAWARWDNARQVEARFAHWEQQQQAKAREQQLQASLASGRSAYPDFDNVLAEADTLGLQVSAVMQNAITESPRAADLVYFLATHPEECLQLAEESRQIPVDAAPVMRRLLESRLAPRAAATATNGSSPGTAAKASVSTAKPPVTPVGSSPVVSDAPPGDEASAAEHARYWNRKLKVPGTR